jgi:cell wall assembly regulator SMI1
MQITNTKQRLTPYDIAQLEQRLNLVFPADLREFYLRTNGGIPQPDSFEKEGEFYTIACIRAIVGPKDGLEGSYVTLRANDVLPPNMIPFADDLNGDYFVYSTAPESFGEIRFLQMDYYDDPERFVVKLAPSLQAFLDSLVDPPEL